MSEWAALGVALLSLLGSGISFYFARQEREAKVKATNTTYYTTLVADLTKEISRYKKDRDETAKRHAADIEKLKQEVTDLKKEVQVLKDLIHNE